MRYMNFCGNILFSKLWSFTLFLDDSAQSTSKKLLENVNLSHGIAFIDRNFGFLPNTIVFRSPKFKIIWLIEWEYCKIAGYWK